MSQMNMLLYTFYNTLLWQKAVAVATAVSISYCARVAVACAVLFTYCTTTVVTGAGPTYLLRGICGMHYVVVQFSRPAV